MKKLILFGLFLAAVACTPEVKEPIEVNRLYTYDGFGEASRHHTMPYKGLKRDQDYHYFLGRTDSASIAQVLIATQQAVTADSLAKGKRVLIEGKGKKITDGVGLQVVLLEEIQSFQPQ